MESKNEILNFVDEGIVVTRDDLTVIEYNKAFKRYFPRDAKIKDAKILKFVSFPKMNSAFEKARSEETFEEESPVYFLDKRMECVVTVFKREERFYWIFKDITPAKLLQRAKADFVSAVSHEFMTPLGIIEGFLSIVRNEENVDEKKRKEYIDRASVQLKRLEKLVDQLLSLSELEMKKYVPTFSIVNLAEMLREAKSEMAYRWKAKNVRILLPDKTTFVKTDGNALYRVFTNLLSNAIKYSFEGGTVRVDVKEDENRVKIAFVDHGIGIKEDEISRIFERFYRASNCSETNAKGMGLGLSLVKHLCDAIGAKIEVDSTYTFGTTFTVLIPKSDGITKSS